MLEETKTFRFTKHKSLNQTNKRLDTTVVNIPDLEFIFKERTFLDSKKVHQKYNIKSNAQLKFFNRVLKRVFDIVFSFLALILIGSWIFPILAILVMFDSKGSAFYVQKRSGRNNTIFNCLKFRTMKCDQQDSFRPATKGDNRITRLGRFLRKTSIDELPQLFNVLSGEMSIVGPRPHAIETDIEYKKMVLKYDYRLAVKPGITGLAQSKGYRGETFKPKDMGNRIRIDIFYIENWTFMLDLKIIALTAYNLIKGDKNAY
jgi:lipopolysaccharide/colanic/teichoic acid biosynthesis glycosyltransferase